MMPGMFFLREGCVSLLFIDGFEWLGSGATITQADVDLLRFYEEVEIAAPSASVATSTSRGSFRGVNLGAINTTYLQTEPVQATGGNATVIVGFYLKTPASLPTAARLLTIRAGVEAQCHVNMDTAGNLTFYRSSNVLGTVSSVLAANTEYYLEFKIVVDDSAGSLELKKADLTANGDDAAPMSVWTVTGVDSRASATTTGWDKIRVTSLGTGTIIDDIYVANSAGSTNNDYLGNIYVETIEPDGAGSSTDFTPSTGSNFQNVDDSPVMDDDSTYNETSTTSHSDLYAVGSISLAGSIYGVQVQGGVRVTTGSNNVRLQARQGSTTGESSDVAVSSTSYVGAFNVFETNPDTAANWINSEIASMEAGIKLQS